MEQKFNFTFWQSFLHHGRRRSYSWRRGPHRT